MSSILSFVDHNKFRITNCLLLPFSVIFFILSQLRVWFYKVGIFKVSQAEVPVIVVGNITIGGSGKTPIVIALCRYFESHNKSVGVVSRGYGGEYSQDTLKVTPLTDPKECGDEPVLIAQQTNAQVVVAKRRSKAIKYLTSKNQVDIIISDDGLQHYAMGRDIEIVVIDGVRRFGNGLLLPSGPLREPVKRLKSVDIVINNGSIVEGEICSQLNPEHYVNLLTNETKQLDYFKGTQCYAVAGIGNPTNFYSLLESQGVILISKSFPDHHPFVAKDLVFKEDYPILMTAKDCVKCKHFATSQMWYLSVSAELNTDFYKQLESKL
ncbi:tetraacyldisaccharide 4'-kinase [Candidatus Thioglobus sp.]|nr:tetraacyldisaccharide 4'-kinase [Candidatus Thioglobus sp.]